jgi:hypothetical protein
MANGVKERRIESKRGLKRTARMRQLIELRELSRSSTNRPTERKIPTGKINKPNQGGDMYPSMIFLGLAN